MTIISNSQFKLASMDRVIKEVLTRGKDDENLKMLMDRHSAKVTHSLRAQLNADYLSETGTFIDKHPDAQNLFWDTLQKYSLDLMHGHEDWHKLLALQGESWKSAEFRVETLGKIHEIRERFTENMKELELSKIKLLIDSDQTLSEEEREFYERLAGEGRVMLYRVGDEYDDYLIKEEVQNQLAEDPSSGAVEVELFNPLWNEGESTTVAMGELNDSFDRKEAVTVMDTVRDELGAEAIQYDSKEKKVTAQTKSVKGTMNVEVKVDEEKEKEHLFFFERGEDDYFVATRDELPAVREDQTEDLGKIVEQGQKIDIPKTRQSRVSANMARRAMKSKSEKPEIQKEEVVSDMPEPQNVIMVQQAPRPVTTGIRPAPKKNVHAENQKIKELFEGIKPTSANENEKLPAVTAEAKPTDQPPTGAPDTGEDFTPPPPPMAQKRFVPNQGRKKKKSHAAGFVGAAMGGGLVAGGTGSVLFTVLFSENAEESATAISMILSLFA